RDFSIVTIADIHEASTPLQQNLTQSIQETFAKQLARSEVLITPLTCTSTISSDYKAGEEATQVTVMVQETCISAAYQPQELQDQEHHLLQQTAQAQLGSHYTTCITVQGAIKQILTTNSPVSFSVQVTGKCWYIFTQRELETIK